MRYFLTLSVYLLLPPVWVAQHNPGALCSACHSSSKIGGTIYSNSLGTFTASGIDYAVLRYNDAIQERSMVYLK
jgi:hypothetical protein